MHRLIVTADDFGLSPEINEGIKNACQNGIVTSTSLLMNAPATAEAVQWAKKNTSLEIGIHLGIVEGYSLLGRKSSLSDGLNYFSSQTPSDISPHVCLHRHWKPFLKQYLTRKIDLGELRQELTLQCEKFYQVFPEAKEIPFANGTQHLHLLPGICDIVLDLCRQFNIRCLRVPWSKSVGGRFPFDLILLYLGRNLKKKINASLPSLITLDRFIGFEVSGKVDRSYVVKVCEWIKKQESERSLTFELMTHPGFNAPHLRNALPWGYQNFGWETEMKTLIDPDIKKLLKTLNIELIRFKDLYESTQ